VAGTQQAVQRRNPEAVPHLLEEAHPASAAAELLGAVDHKGVYDQRVVGVDGKTHQFLAEQRREIDLSSSRPRHPPAATMIFNTSTRQHKACCLQKQQQPLSLRIQLPPCCFSMACLLNRQWH